MSVGAVASVGRTQGASLIVNAFFNTAMNTAMGVASSINAYISMFSQNVTQPMAPQITKSYAIGNNQRTEELLIMSTKYSYLLMLLISSFFLSEPEWILEVWLGAIPPYAPIFLILFISDNLIQSLNSGVQNLIFASGSIGLYQLLVSILNLIAILLGFVVLNAGAAAYFLLVAYIIVSIVKFFIIQWVLRKSMHYDTATLWRNSYLPCLVVTLLFVPVLLVPLKTEPIFKLVFVFGYLCLLVWFIGMNRTERTKIKAFVYNKINK